MNDTHVFAANPLDRASAERRDEEWLEAQRRDPRGRYLPLRELEPLITSEDVPRLVWLDRDSLSAEPATEDAVLLGMLDGVPHFVINTDSHEAGGISASSFVDARTAGALLPPGEAGMLAQARSLLDWHARCRFCAACGGATRSIEGGGRRECVDCATRHYPRVDPSVIVIVEYAGRCLLARRPASPAKRHSCLAGFVEPGESVEEAVRREVLEETKVAVGRVRYHSSQPWPFPSTLMIGCVAEALGDEITVDGVEIASAAWFTRAQVQRALAGSSDALVLPGPVAISHHLIREWAEGTT
jgi:NAD+ diphosphatase